MDRGYGRWWATNINLLVSRRRVVPPPLYLSSSDSYLVSLVFSAVKDTFTTNPHPEWVNFSRKFLHGNMPFHHHQHIILLGVLYGEIFALSLHLVTLVRIRRCCAFVLHIFTLPESVDIGTTCKTKNYCPPAVNLVTGNNITPMATLSCNIYNWFTTQVKQNDSEYKIKF